MFWPFYEGVKSKAEVKICLFAKFLMDATMQDSSKRERSDEQELVTLIIPTK